MTVHQGQHFINGEPFQPNVNIMEVTPFYKDFLNYHDKAKALQARNEGFLPPNADIDVEDPLMMSIHIYDCVERRQAGFSNVLEDMYGKRSPISNARIPQIKYTNKIVCRFLHLIHRFTGSGASFEQDHGYRNSIVPKLIEYINIESAELNPKQIIENCINIIRNHDGPTVTSKGNQPPSLKNGDPSKYKLAQHYYFDNFAFDFITDYNMYLEMCQGPAGIKEAVDFCLKWHKDRGFKQWKFVMTAFVMDDAQYFPENVNPDSACYYGANCIRAFKLMFVKPKGVRIKNDKWFEMCMESVVDDTGGQPYSLEDVCCDMIRYWTEYKPAKGYEYLNEEETKNNSMLKVDGEYPQHVKDKLVKEIGYWKYGYKEEENSL
tara:strand:+ start:104853 stop:105983 length:1131 start_codon:yes stop_codon:yes gene_type:complete